MNHRVLVWKLNVHIEHHKKIKKKVVFQKQRYLSNKEKKKDVDVKNECECECK